VPLPFLQSFTLFFTVCIMYSVQCNKQHKEEEKEEEEKLVIFPSAG